jgi:hypothetical protein
VITEALMTDPGWNVRLYGRHGFTVMPGSPGPLSDGGPVMWRMLRAAR